MTYFNDTNIDEEFGKKKKNNKIDENNRKKFVFIIGGVILAFVMIVLGIILFNKDNGYYIILDGDSEITIYEETDYVEFGYHGYDKKGNEITHLVNVDNTVNTSKIGKYEVTYSLKDAIVKRYVNVIDKGVGDTYINLSGDVEMYLKLGEKYTEPGYLAFDTVDGDLTSKVVVNNNVNTSKSGNYKIVYSVVNEAGVTTSITRTVIVLGADINLTLSNSNKTTGSININVSVNDNYFSYMVLPNGSKVSENTYSYKVSSNGTYKFTSYDKFGNKTEKSITVSNIVVDTGNSGSGNTGGGSTGSGSTGGGNSENSNIPVPKVYASDNIGSGKKHSVGFLVKLTGDNTIYYCLDSNNTCNPSTKYTGELRFATSQQKYLRYKACNSKNECSNIGSYLVNLNIKLVNPDVSTSTSSRKGLANPYQVAYYHQSDSRWSSFDLYGGNKMYLSGCGYNAYAMILTGITHDYSITPSKLVEILRNYRTKYGVEFQAKNESGVLYNAIIHKHSYMKKDYGYDSAKLWRYDEDSISVSEKKEKIVASLKMGHMIFANVPGHYVAFVGINEDDQIYVFDSSMGTSLQDVDELYDDTYYNYRNKCNTNGNCGIRLAYEIYPESGMSLDEWKKIK